MNDTIITGDHDTTQLTVKGNVTQTNKLQDWQDSTGASKASVDKDGKLNVAGFTMANGAANGYILQSDGCGNGTWTGAFESIGNASTICNGRLTIEVNAVPVPWSDVFAATTIYFSPYKGNWVTLYNVAGGYWAYYTLPPQKGLSVGVPSTTNTNYDVFLYDNSGTLALDTVAWTNDTTRATDITLLNGVYVKSTNNGYRYLGTIRTTATSGQCEDSLTKRYVYNEYNQVARKLQVTENTPTWPYSTSQYRAVNGSTNNRVAVVVGGKTPPSGDPPGLLVSLKFLSAATSGASGANAGIGVDTTTANNADHYQTFAVNREQDGKGVLNHYPSPGFHYYQWVEYGTATTTWKGNSTGARWVGLSGFVIQ